MRASISDSSTPSSGEWRRRPSADYELVAWNDDLAGGTGMRPSFLQAEVDGLLDGADDIPLDDAVSIDIEIPCKAEKI